MRTPMGALSKGQRKRALLAMGLLTPQPVLLIDEPFEGLDLAPEPRGCEDASAGTRRRGARCFFRSTRSSMPDASAIASCF